MRTDYTREDEEARRRREIAEAKKRMTERLIRSIFESPIAKQRLAGQTEKK